MSIIEDACWLGGHRKAAIASIRENNPEAYAQHFPDDLVPVRMMPFNADEDPDQVQLGQVYKKTALRQALKALEQWISLPDSEKNTPAEKQLTKKLPQLLELIEKALALK